MQSKINVFNQQKIRSHWDAEQEQWFFAIVDVVAVLSESVNPQVYWRVLKKRLAAEGNETVTNCNGLKMRASDGKMRITDVANTEQMLRLIQSIPSPKAEPFKLWLAKIGSERIDENENPELTIDRAMKAYLQKGYSKEWINQRLKSIEVRKELTDEWENRGVKAGKEFAILTDIITKAWSEKTVREYKEFKNLKKENLRDHMSNLELVLNMLAEATTKEISQERLPATFDESKIIANEGGLIAGNTRKAIEAKTGKQIVTKSSSKALLKTDKSKELP
ncbi:BRO-N domain-containing protein [Dyadobacter aurulentus]|uniref:BRO-N domain-containing protein n=1 Tax=Dyadobacter sp. UC 10 TaxID=2605428 RepID=UPI0011F17660|nr:Bro-N domain-containing protein [Dyadobacter sp. UC 10]KAA0991008.1 Bro-N domain-containing protein [Dyadobacter sp. UC 10]